MPSAPPVTGPITPSTSRPWARWNVRTARRVWRPKTPSAGIPSARWAAATAGPLLPIFRSPVPTALVATGSCALATWPAGTISVAAISAVGTAHFFRFARRAAAASRRRRERFSDRSHTSGLPRSRLPGGSAKIAQPSPLIRGS